MTSSIELRDVTLVTVTGVKIDEAHEALQRCLAGVKFARALLIASQPPTRLDPRITYIKIPPMTYHEYSGFMLLHLHRYIQTRHVLVIQADGYILNPQAWDNSWLDFDYIGAPWPDALDVGREIIRFRNRVGNGGFSLRSLRLLKFTATVNWQSIVLPIDYEDILICHYLHDTLVHNGFRFPSIETAAAFSIEEPRASFTQTLDTVFGFHGKKYLPLVKEREAARPVD